MRGEGRRAPGEPAGRGIGPRLASRRVLGAAVGMGAGWYVLAFAWVAVWTLGYPFQLEWMEAGTVDVVQRILDGGTVYAAPSLDYVPHLYTPMYYFVSAGVAALAGVGFVAPRLVSLLAISAAAFVVADFVRREGAGWRWGWVGAGLLLATFELSGRWFHIARVDSTYLALLVATVHTVRFRGGVRGAVAAGVLASLAILTKQTALVALAPLCLWVLADDARRGVAFLLTTAALVIGAGVVLDVRSEGWFRYYVWTLPLLHETDPELGARLLRDGILLILPGIGLAAAAVVSWFRDDPRRAGFHLVWASGWTLSALLSALHQGAYLNVWMPLHAVVAVLAPLGAFRLARRRVWVTGLVALQLGLLAYIPGDAVPTASDRRGGEVFLDYLAGLEGEVLVPHARWLPTRAGKRAHGLGMAAEDVLGVEHPNEGTTRLRWELATAVQDRRFAAIILPGPVPPPVVARYYRLADTIFDETDDRFTPVTGAPTRPNYVFVPLETVRSALEREGHRSADSSIRTSSFGPVRRP